MLTCFVKYACSLLAQFLALFTPSFHATCLLAYIVTYLHAFLQFTSWLSWFIICLHSRDTFACSFPLLFASSNFCFLNFLLFSTCLFAYFPFLGKHSCKMVETFLLLLENILAVCFPQSCFPSSFHPLLLYSCFFALFVQKGHSNFLISFLLSCLLDFLLGGLLVSIVPNLPTVCLVLYFHVFLQVAWMHSAFLNYKHICNLHALACYHTLLVFPCICLVAFFLPYLQAF